MRRGLSYSLHFVMTAQNIPNRLGSGRLGAAAISFFVISAAAPLTGVAGGFPIAMLLGNGAGAPFAFLLMTVLLLIFSVGYTSMVQHVSNAGAFYAFTAQGLGGVMGTSAAFIALLAYNAMQIGLYGLFGTVAAGTIADLTGLLWPWYVWAGLAWAMIAVMGYRQIDLSLKLLLVLVLLEYGVVLLLNLLILAKGGHQGAGIGFHSFTATALLSGVPIMSILVCFASFMGFEATTIYAEEARDPKRTIPLATYCSVLLIGGFFTLTSWLMIEGNGAASLVDDLSQLKDAAGNPDPTQFIYVLTEKFGGSWLTILTHLLFLSSLFAALQAFHNAAARYFYVLGRGGVLPAKMGATHHRFQSPHMGSMTQTLLAFLVGMVFVVSDANPVLNLFNWLTNIATLSIMILMGLVSIAVVVFYHRHPDLAPSWFKARLMPMLAALLLMVMTLLVLINFNVLIVGDPTLPLSPLAIILPSLVGVFAGVGGVIGWRLKVNAPHKFTVLGRSSQ